MKAVWCAGTPNFGNRLPDALLTIYWNWFVPAGQWSLFSDNERAWQEYLQSYRKLYPKWCMLEQALAMRESPPLKPDGKSLRSG
jgi:hypothetical protein